MTLTRQGVICDMPDPVDASIFQYMVTGLWWAAGSGEQRVWGTTSTAWCCGGVLPAAAGLRPLPPGSPRTRRYQNLAIMSDGGSRQLYLNTTQGLYSNFVLQAVRAGSRAGTMRRCCGSRGSTCNSHWLCACPS
jgi:hypothetical protein